MAHKKTAKPRSFSEYWDGGSCGLTGALAPWSERRGHSGRVRKAMPDCPPHGRAAVRHGGGLGARLKRRFVPPGEGEVGGWCERWRVTGLFADSRGGSTAYIASVRSPPVASSLRLVARPHSPSECSATWRGSGQVGWLRTSTSVSASSHLEVHFGSIAIFRRNLYGREWCRLYFVLGLFCRVDV